MLSNQSSQKISDLLIINHENDLQHSPFSMVSSLGHWNPFFIFVFLCVFCVHSSEKTISSMTTQQFNITTPVVQWPHKQCNDHYNYMLKVVQKFSGHWYSHSTCTLRTLRKYGALSVSKLCLSQCFEFNTGIKVSFVTLMRWHVELKRGITEYVLTLRRLS